MEYDMNNDLDIKLERPETPDDFDVKLERSDSPDDLDPGSEGYSFGNTDGYSPEDSWNDTIFCSSNMMSVEHDGGLEDSKEGVPKRACLVCGDIASGLHYGVASCEACKAFFKRTIQGCIEYACPSSGTCEITKCRRKACQACRFQKCLNMGMMKEGVRHDRVRGGRQKYRRSLELPHVVIMNHGSSRGAGDSRQIGVITQARRISTNDVNVRVKNEPNPATPTSTKLSRDLWDSLLLIEPQKVYAMPDPSHGEDEYKLMMTLSDLTDRELVATIGWAKQVPGFKSLPLPDQMTVLRGTWLDIVCLNIAFRSVPYNGNVCYADDFKLSEEDSGVYEMPRELDRVTRKLITKLSDLRVTREEYALLKAMLLFNSDMNLQYPKGVQQERDRVYDALVEYERPRGGVSLPKRVSELLFLLPLIIHNKFMSREFWLSVRKNGRIVQHRLLREMLEHAFN